MRIGFPVIFIRNGVEYAGLVVSSSPRKDQIPAEPDPARPELTREQRFNELRCSIAFWDSSPSQFGEGGARLGWRQADNVCYLPIDEIIPLEGDFYSEVGAPDPGERFELKAAQAKHAAIMEEGRRAFEALPEEEKARLRAQNQARVELGGRNPPGEIAPPEIRSPDPLDERPMTHAEVELEERIDDELDRPIG